MPKLYLTLKFKFYRTAKNWTQEQYADYLAVYLQRPVSRSLVQAWERGRRPISDTEAMKIATLLDTNFKDLVERK